MPNRRTRTKAGNEERKEYETSIYDGSERIDAMRDEGIDFSDIPEQGGARFSPMPSCGLGQSSSLGSGSTPMCRNCSGSRGADCRPRKMLFPENTWRPRAGASSRIFSAPAWKYCRGFRRESCSPDGRAREHRRSGHHRFPAESLHPRRKRRGSRSRRPA